jgi:hypothetical protein
MSRALIVGAVLDPRLGDGSLDEPKSVEATVLDFNV